MLPISDSAVFISAVLKTLASVNDNHESRMSSNIFIDIFIVSSANSLSLSYAVFTLEILSKTLLIARIPNQLPKTTASILSMVDQLLASLMVRDNRPNISKCAGGGGVSVAASVLSSDCFSCLAVGYVRSNP